MIMNQGTIFAIVLIIQGVLTLLVNAMNPYSIKFTYYLFWKILVFDNL